MSLPTEPIIKKFFSNKIESSRTDWYTYLIKIARIFLSLDGQEYDREELLKQFVGISGRDSGAQRDMANFRDEFGAYGTYLGIYHVENIGGVWRIIVSKAAKEFLCSENPNAAAFCRAQLALFQYPNGAGAGLTHRGTMMVQANIRNDTTHEIACNIRLNPFRVICRTVVALVEMKDVPLLEIAIPYSTLFCIMNDNRVNTTYNPSLETLCRVYDEYKNTTSEVPMNLSGLNNFKRNFHILEKTGLFLRDSQFGLRVAQANPAAAYACIKAISEIELSFSAFDAEYGSPDAESIAEIIAGSAWGQYYDAANLSVEILTALGVEVDAPPIHRRSFASLTEICYETGLDSPFDRNRIVFGAPGTGKSYRLDVDRHDLLGDGSDNFGRVTFHPEYTYSQFVGTYKPVTDKGGGIRYDFVPGPFMRTLVRALDNARSDSPKPYLLIIEEINRSKAASVFGEVFQLLDRDGSNASQYEIQTTEDMRKYFMRELGVAPQTIRIPDNMFIWATMNSADQGVYPMDTAFKRRWSFEYIGIDENDAEVGGVVTLGRGDHARDINWNQLRKAINDTLAVTYNINEDKLLGPYFLSKQILSYGDNQRMTAPEKFVAAFKSKVIMYLYEDAAKSVKRRLFEGCDASKYSSVCSAFDETGIEIFGADFLAKYNDFER